MSEEKYYWKWKNTIIDFNTISDEKDEYSKYMTKKDLVFHYLGTPDEDIHEWYNGGYSSEYNTALRYAKELGLVEDYIDYEEIRYQLQQKENIINELEKWLEERIEKHTEDYLDWKYDRNVYLAVDEELQDVFDKLQELKGSDKE